MVLVILGQWKNYVAAFHNCLKIPYFLSVRRLLKYLVVGGPPFAKSFKPQFLGSLVQTFVRVWKQKLRHPALPCGGFCSGSGRLTGPWRGEKLWELEVAGPQGGGSAPLCSVGETKLCEAVGPSHPDGPTSAGLLDIALC